MSKMKNYMFTFSCSSIDKSSVHHGNYVAELAGLTSESIDTAKEGYCSHLTKTTGYTMLASNCVMFFVIELD